MGPLGPSWGHFGQSWVVLGHLVAILGSWAHPDPLLGPPGAILGPSWGQLGAIFGLLGPSWGHLGQSWVVLGHLGAILRHLGAILGPYWGQLGPSWGHPGATSGPFWICWGPPEAIAGPFGGGGLEFTFFGVCRGQHGVVLCVSSVHSGATFASSWGHATRKTYQGVGYKAAVAVVMTTVGYQCSEESCRYACMHRCFTMFVSMPTKMFAYLWHVDLFGRSECQQAFQCRRIPCI